MKPLHIAFFWHMHQPAYKDPLSEKYILPWIRMHSTKGYFDMISILEDFPQIKQTFNLVPSLLMQIKEYVDGQAKDIYLDYTLKPANELNLQEKKFILSNFFMANWKSMIEPYPRYIGLLKKRGMRALSDNELEYMVKTFSPQEFLDLQVWFNLTWFGYKAREKKKVLRELISKGKFFTEEDKKIVMDTQLEILKSLIPVYKKAEESGQVELTTSPFYHPILPLLINTDFAKRNMPDVPLPQRFSHQEDAHAQIKKAIKFHQEIFSKPPRGLWPSEGSVCPEMIPLLAQEGIKWIATDEAILFNSLGEGGNRGDTLYQPYSLDSNQGKVNIVFRDRNLSDLIGFTYSKNDPAMAAQDFINHIHSIRNYLSSKNKDSLVSIILDGENAWEHYPDGGRNFFELLYQKLSGDDSLRTVRIGDYLDEHPPQREIKHLFTGSWINNNFRIWIGAKEDNQGWNYLKKTRDVLENHAKTTNIPAEKLAQAWDEIYRAEGSDWFWWYGDDFSSDNDMEFDYLFRAHLEKVYKILNLDVPDFIKVSIKEKAIEYPFTPPTNFITPVIDGSVTNYFEWLGAGYCIIKPDDSAMFHGDVFLKALYYGFDLEHLYIRIDPLIEKRRESSVLGGNTGKTDSGKKEVDFAGMEIHFRIFNHHEYKLIFPLKLNDGKRIVSRFYQISKDQDEPTLIKEFETVKMKNIIEFSLPFAAMELKKGDQFNFVIELKKNNLNIDSYPRQGHITVTVPDKNFEDLMWSA